MRRGQGGERTQAKKDTPGPGKYVKTRGREGGRASGGAAWLQKQQKTCLSGGEAGAGPRGPAGPGGDGRAWPGAGARTRREGTQPNETTTKKN